MNFSLVDSGTLTVPHSSDISAFSEGKLWKMSYLMTHRKEGTLKYVLIWHMILSVYDDQESS